jgi:PAS domain S-box-containing protein
VKKVAFFMSKMNIRDSTENIAWAIFRLSIFVAGLGLLLILTIVKPPVFTHFWEILTIAIFAGILVNLPLKSLLTEFTLVGTLTLGSALLYGPVLSSWAVAFGVGLGGIIQRFFLKKPNKNHQSLIVRLVEMGFRLGHIIIPTVIVFYLWGWSDGIAEGSVLDPDYWLRTLGISLSFILLHGFLYLADSYLGKPAIFVWGGRKFIPLVFVEVLPIPLVLLTVLAYPSIRFGAVLILGSMPVVIAFLIESMIGARAKLERRVRELSAINNVSRALRSTLDLDALLPVIQEQVTNVLGINNFYVALYDQKKEKLWYPLAVKQGVQQMWPRRSLADRLTDRVIQGSAPVFLTPQTQTEIVPGGLQPSDVMPTSWVGVPLIASEKTIGCLAVFVETPEVVFTQADLDLLVTISGQVSVAIENALLYDQARRRAEQLETLNQLTQLMTASLDLTEVLAQICQSIVKVGGGRRSAIFLLDPEAGDLYLAQGHKLRQVFMDASERFSMADTQRARCLINGRPTITSNVHLSSLEPDYKQLLMNADVHAFGDFPLITPDGQIGFLSVYFDDPHLFPQEEVELLQTFASQAALAVSNARLHAQTDRALAKRVHQLRIIEAVGRELSQAIHSERLFELILSYALEITKSPCGAVDQYDPLNGLLEAKAVRGYGQELNYYSTDRGIAGRVIRSKKPAIVGDVRQDPDYLDLTNGETNSQLSVPIVHENQALGVITLENPELNAYSQNDLDFVTQLANQAAIALVNAQLFADVTQGRKRLAAILDSVEEGILMLDVGGRVVLANALVQTISSLSHDELLGVRLSDLSEDFMQILGYSKEELEALLELIGSGQVATSSKDTYQVTVTSPQRILERLSSPVWGQQDEIIGWMIVLRDVTEEYEIAQARELITETLVHDLRSPMSAVLGALDILDELLPPEQHTDMVDQSLRVAQRSVNRVLKLVETMLDISRMQSGSLEIERSTTNIPSLVESLLKEFIVQANEYGIILRNEIPHDLPVVNLDKEKVTRVIANLVDNALKYTPEGGLVTLLAEHSPSDDEIIFQVRDTGPGIPSDFREKIFDRFAQVPGRRGRKRGSGLGLTFCRLAVEAHGGRIWVESVEGQGSSFFFTIPVVI